MQLILVLLKTIYGAILLTSDVKCEKEFKPEKINDRPANHSYFSFQCELDSKIIINSRINYKPLKLHFCLNIPQYIYYPDSVNVEALLLHTPTIQNPSSVIRLLLKSPNNNTNINTTENYFNIYIQEETSIVTNKNNSTNVATTFTCTVPEMD